MSASLSYRFDCTVTETLETGIPASSSPTIVHNGFNSYATLTSSTSPPVTKVVSFEPALVGDTLTIDLTSLTGTNGASVTLDGLKVQIILFNNGATTGGTVAAGTNSSVTIEVGGSNPYDLFGDADGEVTIPAGGTIMWFCPDILEDVDSTHKNILLSGSGTDAFEMTILAG